jgi:hypothetical protein
MGTCQEAAMRREAVVIIIGVLVAAGVIFALLDERSTFTVPTYKAPATEAPDK